MSRWEVGLGLVGGCALLGGYAWLAALSRRMRIVSRRLALHICREPDGPGARARVDAAEILRRERAAARPMLPPRPVDATQPMPAARARNREYGEGG